MPPEVIDLLSSPEVEPRSTSAVSNQASHVPPPSAQRNILDDELDYDTFDLTADDVPPLLTAKSPARKRPRLGMGDLSEDDQVLRPIENSVQNPTLKETSTLDVEMSGMSSDGFLDIDNVTKPTTGGGRPSQPARKRQRLSPPIPHSNSPIPRLAQTHVSATTKSPSRLVTSRNSSSRVIEDVEFSSSFHISSPKISKTPAPLPKPTTYRDEDDHSDPFKSPPPRPTREQKGKGRAMTTVTQDVTIIEDSDSDGPVSATPQRTNNRILSGDENRFAYSPPRANPQPPERSRTLTAAAEWDPISSSAPLPSKPSPRRPLETRRSDVIALDDSDDGALAGPLSDDDDDDFPDISVPRFQSSYAAIEVTGPSKRTFTKSASTTTGPTKAKATGAKKTAEERSKEKEVKALEKKAAAERKKQERERERQEKAEEKQRAAARAEANKLRTKKEVATPEMIVDLPSSLPQVLRIQTEEYLKKVDVKDITTWTSPVDNVVRWRRVLRSRYNKERHHYDPIPETIETDKFSLVYLPAAEFAKLVMGPEGQDLEAHVLKMQRHFPGHQILYLIEGLADLLSKSRNKRNREFASAVRSGLAADDDGNSAPTSTARRQRKNDPALSIDENQICMAFLQLQLHHHMLIHDTARPADTALVIQLFTQQLATAPYKQRQDEYFMKSAGFCMESGQVRTGIGLEEIYVRMLQEIARITAPIAMGIVNEYPRVAQLVLALEKGGPMTLENVRRAINKEGEVGEKRVGKAVSKRLWKIFTGRDEMSMEV
ncbi:hypothetical protein B0T20DRAFT_421842 [Sordaria brevicollis]|uniref:ERCC4 domain-containing protein n=1 Tax=Sordaria brevicollis TaxID=83679 RepID=A0AAE0U6C5_SORBR|nr:hypothetical protein B0T20DRAFT_421842 [Sordaria brevicollis]